MALKFVQVNLNHCLDAQDLLFQSMALWLAHVAILSEPYHIPQRDNWAGDHDGTAAIITQTATGSPPFEKVEKGKGFVAALLGGITVVSVYFSPNRSVAEFEAFLVEVGAVILTPSPSHGDLQQRMYVGGN
ncbi:uncharacterized protein LOC134805428 [Cydia splendana]|uniref:uncharacterized protein LOC134805428 n=1 Tax=Cydia splendana TaxID=1100963 RepID=UPI00300CE77A